MSHQPVLVKEVLNLFKRQDKQLILDCTFGAGGHTRALLENYNNCEIIALDRDDQVLPFVEKITQDFPSRFTFFNHKFSQLGALARQFDGILLDLGVSSMQLDAAERGFSFNKDGPLTMTMGQNDLSAYQVVNHFTEEEIVKILIEGEEFRGIKIAEALVKARKIQPIESTKRLADIIAGVVKKTGKIHPATLSFQAIRMYINQELQELAKALEVAPKLLQPKGVLGIITFQGLEDLLVKKTIKSLTHYEQTNKFKDNQVKPLFKKLCKIKATREEILRNPRARSAKLIAITKL
jgi:16S rRNA (cytosine1402-N4)-methyltransferase